MKIRIESFLIVCCVVVPMAAQKTNSPVSNSPQEILHTTVKLIGPNGAAGANAATVLQVIGGRGGDGDINNVNGGNGSGIVFTAGAGGGSSQDAGSGGSLAFIAGAGGSSSEDGGSGGSILLQPGAANCGVICGVPGNVIVALPTGGNLGVGTNSPSNTLEVVAGGTTLADAWTTRSSLRLKTNIHPLAGALEKVERLQGVSYDRKTDGKPEIGLIAEDVSKVVPELVSRNPATHEVQGMDYSRLAALLIEAIKTQQAEIQELKTEIVQMKSPVAVK